MKMTAIACCFILVGMLYCYADLPGWQKWYFIWDKTKDVMLLASLTLLAPKAYRRIPLFTLIFVSIRLIWDIIVEITGIYINHPLAVNILFIILLMVCVTAVLKEWHRQS